MIKVINYKKVITKIKNIGINWSTIYENIVDLIYPRRCPICDNVMEYGGELCCSTCEEQLETIKEPLCKKCGKKVEEDIEYCFDCTKKTYFFLEGRAVYVYNNIMKESISRFKYKSRCEYADFYVEKIVSSLGDYIKDKHIDAIIPVPIHENKLHKRGYNQADVLAKRLGKRLNIKVVSEALVRVKDTTPQKNLDNINRTTNLINAIRINNKCELPYYINNILLVDDIYTTGATINSCAKQLKKYNKRYSIYYVAISIGNGI